VVNWSICDVVRAVILCRVLIDGNALTAAATRRTARMDAMAALPRFEQVDLALEY
jgi:hypothetical protein